MLVVEYGILRYDIRKLFNRWLNEAFDLSLAQVMQSDVSVYETSTITRQVSEG